MTLAKLDGLYKVASRLVVTRTVVPDDEVDQFSIATRELEKYLGADAAEEPWLSGLAPLRRARWLVHTVPLPPQHSALDLPSLLKRLEGSARLLGAGGSDELRHWLDISLAGLHVLATDPHPAFADAARDVLRDGEDRTASIVLMNASFVQPVKDYFAGQQVLLGAVLTPAMLRSHPAHESQLVVGTSRLYPDWVWTAPRAEIITVLHRASATDRSSIPSAMPSGGQPAVAIRGHKQDRMLPQAFVVEAPPINWRSVRQDSSGAPRPDDVKARTYLLAGQHHVLLEASDGATAFLVDPSGATGEVIGRVPTSAVEPGDFILLRTTFGDEDVIVQLANKIMGSKAMTLRGQQERWKKALRAAVQRDGIDTAYLRLGALGCKARNLPRWLGPDAIRTQSPGDFHAICTYGGLTDEEAARLWAAMAEIASAHIRAGHQMRELLEKRLEKTDLSALHETGHMTVTLQEIDAGTLGIFRVEAKDDEVVLVNPRDLRVAARTAAS